MMSVNGGGGRRPAAASAVKAEHQHPGPVSLNMVIGPARKAVQQQQQQHQQGGGRESNDTLSQLEQQVRSIEVNTMAAQRLREELSQEPDTYLRYREHEDLLGTINHEPER